MKLLSFVIATLISSASFQAQAGLLDDLLKNPTIQSILNRADLTNMVNTCKDVTYRRANQTQCANFENALLINKLPVEMRVVMSNQQSANSLRELCGVAQGSVQANSYLCAELRKAEIAIGINSSIPQTPAPAVTGRDNVRG